MGLFGKLFGKKEEPKKGETHWMHTNAPAHWPKIEHMHINTQNVEQAGAFNTINIAGELKQKGFEIVRLSQNSLFAEGIMNIDFVLKENGKIYNVLIYPDIYENASSDFLLCKRLLAKRGETAIYYSFAPIDPKAPESKKLGRWRVDMFSKMDKDPPKGFYSMWWPTEQEPKFSSSPVYQNIKTAFHNINGYEFVVLTSIGKNVGVLEDKPEVVTKLPEDLVSFPVNGPDGMVIYVSASLEKGLRFHFNTSTPIEYRNNCWKHYSEYTTLFKQQADSKPGLKDTEMEPNPLEWFDAFMSIIVKEEKEGKTIKDVGIIMND
jgi:hypothetical protein